VAAIEKSRAHEGAGEKNFRKPRGEGFARINKLETHLRKEVFYMVTCAYLLITFGYVILIIHSIM